MKTTPFTQKAAARRAQIGRKGLRRRPPKWIYPESVEREYQRALVDTLEELQLRVVRMLIERIPDWNAEARRNEKLSRLDDWIDDLEALMAALRLESSRIYSDPQKTATLFAEMTVAFNYKQFSKIVNAVFGVNPLLTEPWLKDQIRIFVSQNTALIKSIPQQFLNDVEGVIQRGIANGTPTSVLKKELAKRFEVSNSRAQLIAQDQIGKFNGALTQARQTNLGIGEYIWRTSEDSRVRHTHRQRNGKKFKWSKPPPDGHPGEPVRCRCYAEPVLTGLIDETELK